jgi:hypothetical protein
MGVTQRSLLRVAILAFAVIGVYNFLSSPPIVRIQNIFGTSYPSKEILKNPSLTEGQCRTTFPGLTKEIDDAVTRGPFQLERARDDYTGLVQGRIADGKVISDSLKARTTALT